MNGLLMLGVVLLVHLVVATVHDVTELVDRYRARRAGTHRGTFRDGGER